MTGEEILGHKPEEAELGELPENILPTATDLILDVPYGMMRLTVGSDVVTLAKRLAFASYMTHFGKTSLTFHAVSGDASAITMMLTAKRISARADVDITFGKPSPNPRTYDATTGIIAQKTYELLESGLVPNRSQLDVMSIYLHMKNSAKKISSAHPDATAGDVARMAGGEWPDIYSSFL